MANDPLARYWSILDGDVSPRYLDAKKVKTDADLLGNADILWQVHDGLLAESSGEGDHSLLDLKIELVDRIMESCSLCERVCGVDRTEGVFGHCGVADSRVSSEFLHMGEEPELVPSHTIFLSGCTFDCVFCQNWDISTRPGSGVRIDPVAMARTIERRARITRVGSGMFPGVMARNVNWVGGDPTSHLSFILRVLKECTAPLPQIWNSNMYLTEPALRLLNGVIDVYLTDFKYGNDDCARRLSNVDNYTSIIRRNHILASANGEMIIRHLVLPSHLDCCTKPVLTWIAENLDCVKVNVMAQFRPAHRAGAYAEISRPLSSSEYAEAIDYADKLNLDLCD